MASELRVDKIHNEGGDNDSGIDLSTNDQIVLKTANTTRLTMNATGQTTIVGEGGSTTTNLQQGLGKHWCYFSMAGTSFSDSFNSSSLTDDSTGDFLVNMTTAFANLNYAVQASSNCYAGNSWQVNQSCNAKQNWGNTNTTTSYDFASYANSAYTDATYNYALGHGDLA